MKSRKAPNAGSMSKVTPQLDLTEEATKHGPTPEQIRERAYEIHIARGGIHGCDLDDWLQAERELQSTLKDSGLSKKK